MGSIPLAHQPTIGTFASSMPTTPLSACSHPEHAEEGRHPPTNECPGEMNCSEAVGSLYLVAKLLELFGRQLRLGAIRVLLLYLLQEKPSIAFVTEFSECEPLFQHR